MPVFVPRSVASWSFIDYVAIFLMRLAFEHYVVARLQFCSTWTVGGFSCVVGLVVFAEVFWLVLPSLGTCQQGPYAVYNGVPSCPGFPRPSADPFCI